MFKKSIIIAIIIIIILIVLPLGWYWWQQNKPPSLLRPPAGDDLSNQIPTTIQYYNEKYNYYLKFPEIWLIGFYGESKEKADVVWFVSDESDFEVSDESLLKGVKVLILLHNLKEMLEVDSEISKIKTAQYWLEWERVNWVSFDSEAKGEYQDWDLIFNGIKAVKTVFEKPLYPELPKSMEVTFLDPTREYIYKISYFGHEPAYSQNLKIFDNILESFSFR